MSDKFQIVITGSNQSHQAFVQLTADAKAAGLSVEQMGTKSSRSFTELNQRAAAFGVGLGTVIGGVAQAGRAFQDQENQIRALNRAYGDASADIQQYAKDLQQATTYSDDAARQSAITASTLARNYGLTADEIQKVITASADLAAVSGLSLTDATQRVTAAIRGEAESAEALGLTMNQQAIDRAGLTLTMSNEEAAHFRLNALLEQSAFAQGAAGDAAETHAGQAKQLLNVMQDQIQAFGEATGVTGEYLSVLSQLALIAPLVGGGIANIVAGLGGVGAIAKAGGALALPVAAGLSIAGLYNQYQTRNTPGGGWYENFLLQGMGVAGNIPGMGGVGAYSQEQLQRNDVESALAAAFYVPPGTEKPKDYLFNLITAQGYGYEPGVLGHEPTQTDISAWIEDQAKQLGMTTGQWIASAFGRPDSGYVTDPTTGLLINRADYTGYQQARTIAAGRPGQGNVYGMGAYGLASTAAISPYPQVSPEARAAAMRPHGAPMEFDPSAQMARAGGIPEGGGSGFLLDAAANADKTTAALKKTYGAYYELVTGMTSAGEAASAFKITQDELIENQSVYGQQISEFSQQQNALTAGRDILLERQKEGVTLTKEEQDLLDNYPELYEQVSTATDNATVSAALISAQYIENMEKSDQYKTSLDETNSSVGGLTEMIRLFILSLDGVPPEVRTQLLLMGTDKVHADLQAAVDHLNAVNGQTATFFVNTVTTGVSVGSPSGPSITDQVRHGGVVGYDNGGVVIHAGEAGPEYMSFANGGSAWAMHDSLYNVPRGTYVTPAPASVGKSSSGLHFNGPVSITVVANDPRQMAAAINEWAVGSSRS